MKIAPINKLIFNGRTVNFTMDGKIDDIKSMDGYYPDSTIEKTVGVSHKISRGKIYFADPMEFVNNDTKFNVDYVVYDNEPNYPDIEGIRKNYFETNRTNYRKNFESVRDYFYRREMGHHANSNEAKYQQWQAAECIRLYDKAGDLRYKKETAEDEVKGISAEECNIKAGIAATKKEIESQKNLKMSLEIHIDNLKSIAKQGTLSDAMKKKMCANERVIYMVSEVRVTDALNKRQMAEDLKKTAYYNEGMSEYAYETLKYGKYADTTKIYSSVKSLMEMGYCAGVSKYIGSSNKLSITETINEFEKIVAECSSFIDEMNGYVSELTSKAASVNENMQLKKSFIESCKEKLVPLFDELKAFYVKQGIKGIKK